MFSGLLVEDDEFGFLVKNPQLGANSPGNSRKYRQPGALFNAINSNQFNLNSIIKNALIHQLMLPDQEH